MQRIVIRVARMRLRLQEDVQRHEATDAVLQSTLDERVAVDRAVRSSLVLDEGDRHVVCEDLLR